jgi:3-phosphoshikimate 1-carboxyvinyltransferase
VTVRGVGVNPTRTGALDVLEAMGARVGVATREGDGEPVADLSADPRPLRGTEVGGALVPRAIDEIPILAVAGACAEGPTVVRDAAELRVKESDRIAAIKRELGKMGVRIDERPDGIVVQGGQRLRGAHVASGGDHRMAMALAVAGLVADGETVVEDVACVQTSFPTFADLVNQLAGGPAVTVSA